MATKNLMTGLLVAALAFAGCKSTPANEARPEGEAQPTETREVEYFPLVPKVEWEKLNALQKTTAAIAIVPGCVLSALANVYIWVTAGTSLEFHQ